MLVSQDIPQKTVSFKLSDEESRALAISSVRDAIEIIAKRIADVWMDAHAGEIADSISMEDVLERAKERIAKRVTYEALRPFDAVLGINRDKSVEEIFRDV